jgi:uncharacterized membrane-anchored protein
MNDDEQKQAFDEAYSERAAIREYDGGQSRAEAEAAARIETEEHIFQCMVRQLIQWAKSGKRDDVKRWLDGAEIKGGRDQAKRKRYVDALNEQIKLKNQGRQGEWIEQPVEVKK